MEITGKKNLELMKKAFESHLTQLSHKVMRGTDNESAEKWDPEIRETNKMLDSIEINLGRYEQTPADHRYEAVLTGE